MTPADIDRSVWQEIARQAPATLAFLLISFFMISQFVKTNSKLTSQLMEFLKNENTRNSNALDGVAKSLQDMGANIVNRLDEHDRCVEPKVLSALERYNGQDRRQGEGRRETNGVHQTPASHTKVTRHNRKTAPTENSE